jgi:hypothetical protein
LGGRVGREKGGDAQGQGDDGSEQGVHAAFETV